MSRDRLKSALRIAAVAVFWIAVWSIAAIAVDRELLIPRPWAVAARLWTLIRTSEFWISVGSSMGRILGGYLLGVAVGAILAFVTYGVPFLRALLSPLFTVVRATPVASFILIALVWIGSARVPVFTAFLMVLPIVWGSVGAGLESVGRELPEVARVFGFSPYKKLTLLYLPAVRKPFASAAVTSMGLAWKAGVAAEVLCVTRASVGKYLYYSKLYLETVDLYAWTLTVILVSLVLEAAVRLLSRGKEGNRA